jgi:hypothetical protein
MLGIRHLAMEALGPRGPTCLSNAMVTSHSQK